jgi:radical SAM superfamily enzyme YgiQ (UPF0313 family)
MTDIVLVQPPIRDFYLTAKRTVPYGLACIASPLLNAGWSVEIIDGLASRKAKKIELPAPMSYLEEFYQGPDISPFCLFYDFKRFGLEPESLGDKVRDSVPRLVGISSLFSAYAAEPIEIAEIVKKRCPGALIVLGGHHPTQMPEEVLSHDCVDFIIRGEGEAAMLLLAQAIGGKGSVESVPGIGFKKAGGKMFLRDPAVLADLDQIPLPARELIDQKFYRRGKTASAVIAAGRGCPAGCSYCSIGCASWCGFRLKSPQRLLEEMRRAVLGAGARFIDFEDENISFKKEWFLEVLKQIESQFYGLGLELRAMNGLFAPSLDEEVVCAMKKAGFRALNLSLCTTSRPQLQRFRRPDVRQSFESALLYAQKYGLDAVAYIIVGAPGQDPMESVADLVYLADKNAIVGVSVFYPSPGSLDFEKCSALGLLPDDLSLLRATALPISDTTSRLDSVTLLRLGRILNFFKSLGPAEKREVLALYASGEHIPEKFDMRDTPGSAQTVATKRRAIGKTLLAFFLRDGVIYGVNPDGRLFVHNVSSSLCTQFQKGFLKVLS